MGVGQTAARYLLFTPLTDLAVESDETGLGDSLQDWLKREADWR